MGGCTPSGLPRTTYSITYPLSFKFLRTLLRFFALIQKLNPFIFKRFRTLYQKHGGGRRVTMLFLSGNSNLRYLAYRISRRRPPALSSFPISLPPYFLSGASSNHQSLQSTHVALPKRPRRPYHRSFTPNPKCPRPPSPAQPPSTRTTPAAYTAASVSTPVPLIVSGTSKPIRRAAASIK